MNFEPRRIEMVHAVNRKLTSPEVQNILKHEESNTDMYIFVKKR